MPPLPRFTPVWMFGALAFLILLLGPRPLMAQNLEQGEAQVSLRAFQETDGMGLRDNLGGLHLEFHQLLHHRGLFNFVVDGNRGHGSVFGRNYVEGLGVPWRNRRVSLTVGDFFLPLDRGPFRFSNLYVPYVYAAGGALSVNSERWSLAFFGGRNQQPLGPRVQILHTLPDSLAGVQATFKWKPNLEFQARYLHTHARTPVQITGLPATLLEFRGPRRSDNLFLDLYYHASPHVTLLAELATTNFTPQAQLQPLSSRRNFVSYLVGPSVKRERFQLEANLVRQGLTYIPLSNTLVGDRQGEFLTATYRPSPRLRFNGSEAHFHNNPERNPILPTLKASNQQLSLGFVPGFGWSLNLIASRGRLESRDRLDFVNTYRAELYKNYRGYQTGVSWQFFKFDGRAQSAGFTRFHSFSVDQRKAFRTGHMIFGGLTLQHGSFPTGRLNSLNVRAGGNLRLFRILNVFGQTEFGRDFANETLFTTNNLRTTVAGFNLNLPRAFSLRGDLVVNSLRTNFNPESVFFAGAVAGAPVIPLIGFTHRLYFLELRKELRWGRSRGLPLGASEEILEPLIPAYGVLEGYAFNDRNQNGVRDPGEEGLPSVEVSLDGRTAATDANGHFRIPDARTGSRTLLIQVDHLPAFYSAPAQPEIPVRVKQRGNAPVWIPLQVLGSIAGRVDLASGGATSTGYEGAEVVLGPGEHSTFSDARGNYRFDNLPPGDYSVRIKAETLPQDSKLLSSSDYRIALSSGVHVGPVNFQFRGEAPQRPVERIVHPPEKITIPPVQPPPQTPSQPPKPNHNRNNNNNKNYNPNENPNHRGSRGR